jgi:hypothetical protein
MGFLSIILNLFTLFIVAIVFYITFNKRKDGSTTWVDSYLDIFSFSRDKEIVSKPVYGNIGNFTGQDWTDGPCEESLFGAGLASVLIDEKQDDVSDFMDTGKPNYVGTGAVTRT